MLPATMVFGSEQMGAKQARILLLLPQVDARAGARAPT